MLDGTKQVHESGIIMDLSRDTGFDTIGLERLRDSYMKEGEVSPQERFAYVSNQFSSNPEHAQRLYDYVSNFWFGYATPILSFGRNKYGLPISCLTENNYIQVKHKGCVSPKEIKVGDEVLTHKGRWKRVLAVKESISNDIWHLQTASRTTKTEITGNHPILTNRGWIRVDQLLPHDLIAVNDKIEYVEEQYTINNLNDYYKVPDVNLGAFAANILPNTVDVDEELCWALGLWFAEGSTHGNGVHITMAQDEYDIVVKWVNIMRAKFCVNGNHSNTTRTGGNRWSSGHVNSAVLMKWFDGEFGKGSKLKYIPEWIQNLPKSYINAFYDGFYLGDGYKTTKQKAIGISNPHLICGLYQILLKLERPVSLNLTKKAGKLSSTRWTCEIRECLDASKPSTQKSSISAGISFVDGNRYVPIKSLVKASLPELPVWDIQVEEDESFTVNGILVHNCFLNFVDDSKEGLINNLSETNWLSMMGGGVGVYWDIRGQDEKSVGVIPHMKVYDDSSLAYKQGTTRRGSYAMYLDISHPDIISFLEMRKETGDPRRKCLNLHYGVNIPDSFMEIIENCMRDASFNDNWDLKDPETGKIHDTVSAKELWQKILDLRAGQGRGEPYIHFIDNSNKTIPEYLRNQGYRVRQSNLCSEIMLHTDKYKTAVCCLSSLNLDKWDEYKDNYQFFKDVMEMLDNVLQYFIDHSTPEIARAVKSAKEERSVGLGVMGFHSYLQQNGIPYEGVMTKSTNLRIFKHIRQMVDQANLELGAERGLPIMMEGTGKRFAHTMALAPTASNALICGNVSPSAELWRANAFRQDTMSGTFIQKNKYLDILIKQKAANKELDYDATWLAIVQDEGSVQNLSSFTELEKAIYKTAAETDMLWAVEHTADRQPFIDQGQSFNIFIRPDISVKRLHAIHFMAWKKGVKSMYYVRTEKLANTEKVSQRIERKRIEDEIDLTAIVNDDVCLSCEG